MKERESGVPPGSLSHRRAVLADGTVREINGTGKAMVCSCHGWLYVVRDGHPELAVREILDPGELTADERVAAERERCAQIIRAYEVEMAEAFEARASPGRVSDRICAAIRKGGVK